MKVIKRILKTKVLLLGLLMMMFAANAQNRSYITNHKTIAIILSQSYGIPAQLILAVAAVESSCGKGPAAKVLNNHFGIEGKNEYVNRYGHKSRYKQYANELSSYIDFCKLMTRKRFYKKLKGNNDCAAWVKAMSKAHYSEVPEEWERKIFTMLSVVKAQSRKETSPLLAIK